MLTQACESELMDRSSWVELSEFLPAIKRMGFLQAFQQIISFLTWTHQTSTIPLSSDWSLNHNLCGKTFSIHFSFMYTHTTHTHPHTSPLRTCGGGPGAPLSRGSSGREGAVEQGAGTLRAVGASLRECWRQQPLGDRGTGKTWAGVCRNLG